MMLLWLFSINKGSVEYHFPSGSSAKNVSRNVRLMFDKVAADDDDDDQVCLNRDSQHLGSDKQLRGYVELPANISL